MNFRLAACILGLSACISPLPEQNQPCPCATGWTCCSAVTAVSVCVTDIGLCPADAGAPDAGSTGRNDAGTRNSADSGALGDAGPQDGGAADAGAADGGSNDGGLSDSGCLDGGACFAGTVALASGNNTLPAPWQGHVADFNPQNTGAASQHLSELVALIDLTTSAGGAGRCGSAGYPSCIQCPSNFLYQSSVTGESFCDGFAAHSGSGTAYVDDFTFIANFATCVAQFNSAALPSIRGLWSDYFLASSGTNTYSIALTACSDVGVGVPYSGTGTARPGTVASLLASHPVNGQAVTAQGVVVAVWSAAGGGTFGAALEDPAGGPNAGIQVLKLAASSSSSAPPNVGDDVTVTGTFSSVAAPVLVIRL
jgi:hypothetical protein